MVLFGNATNIIGQSSNRPFAKMWNGVTLYFASVEGGNKWLEDTEDYHETLVLALDLWDSMEMS
jgi:hypothetical protein